MNYLGSFWKSPNFIKKIFVKLKKCNVIMQNIRFLLFLFLQLLLFSQAAGKKKVADEKAKDELSKAKPIVLSKKSFEMQ